MQAERVHCYKCVKIRFVAACHLQTFYNLLKQLAASLWLTSFDNQLATNLLPTGNRLVVNKLSQALQTHPDINLLMTSLFGTVNSNKTGTLRGAEILKPRWRKLKLVL